MEISNFINPRDIDSRPLKGLWYYGEAPTETSGATDNAVKMIVIDKAMGNIKAAANQVMTFDKAKMEEVIKSYPNKKFIIIETTLYKELITLSKDKFKDKLYSLK
jgi:hypothetical protein